MSRKEKGIVRGTRNKLVNKVKKKIRSRKMKREKKRDSIIKKCKEWLIKRSEREIGESGKICISRLEIGKRNNKVKKIGQKQEEEKRGEKVIVLENRKKGYIDAEKE